MIINYSRLSPIVLAFDAFSPNRYLERLVLDLILCCKFFPLFVLVLISSIDEIPMSTCLLEIL